jgi:hypothetical protein
MTIDSPLRQRLCDCCVVETEMMMVRSNCSKSRIVFVHDVDTLVLSMYEFLNVDESDCRCLNMYVFTNGSVLRRQEIVMKKIGDLK